jgi:hypothetical protein
MRSFLLNSLFFPAGVPFPVILGKWSFGSCGTGTTSGLVGGCLKKGRFFFFVFFVVFFLGFLVVAVVASSSSPPGSFVTTGSLSLMSDELLEAPFADTLSAASW